MIAMRRATTAVATAATQAHSITATHQITNLTGFQSGFGTPIGSVDSNQLWGADYGVLK